MWVPQPSPKALSGTPAQAGQHRPASARPRRRRGGLATCAVLRSTVQCSAAHLCGVGEEESKEWEEDGLPRCKWLRRLLLVGAHWGVAAHGEDAEDAAASSLFAFKTLLCM